MADANVDPAPWRSLVAACGAGRLLRLTLVQLVAALSEGAALLALVPVVSSVTRDREMAPLGLDLDPAHALVALGFLVLVRAIAQWIAAVQATRVRLVTVDRLRTRALASLFAAEWAHVATLRRGHLIQLVTTETVRVGMAIDLVTRLTVGALVALATAAAMLLIAPGPALTAIGVLLLVLMVSAATLRTAHRAGHALTDRVLAFGGAVSDGLTAIRLIRAHDAGDRWHQRLQREAAATRAVELRYVTNVAATRAVLGAVAVAVAVGLVLLGHARGIDTSILAVAAVGTMRLVTLGQGLVAQGQQLAHTLPALRRVQELVDEAERHRDRGAPQSAGRSPGEHPARDAAVLAELVDVRVTYPGSSVPALDSVSITVPARGLVVVSGPSGGGKSTLLDVLSGLHPPDTGAVLVGGEVLTDPAQWRARISYVPQQTVLVPGTVRDNLAWLAHEAPSDQQLWDALSLVDLSEVVRALPRGLDTYLPDLPKLSGGEQQRLSLARAILREPELLLLDEATGALDRPTELRILARLAARDCATVVVTHRAAPDGLAVAHYKVDNGTVCSVTRKGFARD